MHSVQIINEEVSGPSTNPWGTLLATDVQLDIVPLITSPKAWPFRQFPVPLTVHLPNPSFVSLFMRMLRQTVSKTLLKLR